MCSVGLAVNVFCADASSRSRSIEYSPPPFFSASGFNASGARIDFFLTRCPPSSAAGFFFTWKTSAPASSSSKLSSEGAVPPSPLPFFLGLDFLPTTGTIAGASSAPAPASSPSSSDVFLRRLPRLGIPPEPGLRRCAYSRATQD